MRVHRILPCLLVIAGALAVAAPAASADEPTVDPATLQPPPPPDARCQSTGRAVICRTVVDFTAQAEPVDFGLPCGMVYITVTDVRHGLRFYEDGLLVRRHVTAPGGVSGFLSLAAPGDGPRIELVGHLNWWSTFSVPGDESTALTTSHGLDTRLNGPGGGVIAIIAGRTDPEGAHSGVARFVDDPAVADAICAALTP
jgi:hypothetical protein